MTTVTRLTFTALAAAALMTAALPAQAAAPAAPPASPYPARLAGKVNFNGYWTPVHTSRPQFNGGWDGPGVNPPPLTPWAMKFVQDYKKGELAGDTVSLPSKMCWPKGVPYNMQHILPMDFIQREDELVILVENRSMPRHIYLDGRPHPSEDEYVPSSNGHSIGRWEGDTLVVDTVYLDEANLLTLDRIPHGPELHVVERMKIVNGVIENETTLTDPKSFTKPFTYTLKYERSPPGTTAVEYACKVDATRLTGEAPPIAGAAKGETK